MLRSSPTSANDSAGQRKCRRPRAAAATSAVKPVSITKLRSGPIAAQTK